MKYVFHNKFRMIIIHDQKYFQKISKAAVRRCFSKQVFLKILQYSQRHTCSGFMKRESNTVFSREYWKIFKNTYSEENLKTTASALINIELVIKYWASVNLFLIKNVTEQFSLRRFVDLGRVYCLQIISRNHSSMFLLIDLQKAKTYPK